MQFYRVVGAAVMIASALAGAYMLNSKASAALSKTDAFLSLLRYVKSQIECFSLPISDIMQRCDKKILSECGYTEEEPQEDLCEFVRKCHIGDEAAEKILLSFFSEFGMNYREEQIRQCDYYIGLLEEYREGLAGELPKRKKLNSTLCIASALALVILLI